MELGGDLEVLRRDVGVAQAPLEAAASEVNAARTAAAIGARSSAFHAGLSCAIKASIPSLCGLRLALTRLAALSLLQGLLA